VDAAAETRYAQSGDANIAYQVVGDAPRDLLVFHAGNISIDSMDDEPSMFRFYRRLASFSRVIRFDRRGLGLSDPLVPSNPTTMEQLVEDALAVLDAAGSRSAACFADGPCGEAILMGATHPDRITRLVLVNATARIMRAPDYPFGVPEPIVTHFLETVTRTDAVEQGVDDLAILNPSLAGDSAFRSWWVRSGRRAASPAVARAILGVKWLADVRPLLPQVRIPTLVMHRKDYRAIGLDHGRYLAEHIPEARFRELPGADNLYWVGDTELMLEEIEEFLTGTRPAPEQHRMLATVLFTDIVDSTAQASALGDRAWRDRLDLHDAMVRRQLERFSGREIKTIGDGFLATFDGPARAIQCAVAIRDGATQLGLEVRAGLHTGEIELHGEDIGGMTVNIGARVAALAGPREVLVSRTVADLVVGSGLAFSERGEHELKGVPGTWTLLAVEG
jgi:class 3 adenylate cyclase